MKTFAGLRLGALCASGAIALAAERAGPEDPDYVAWSRANPSERPRQMEKLGRGVVALPLPGGKVWVSWRLLATDPDNVEFNLYCVGHGDTPIKINRERIREATCLVDPQPDPRAAHSYLVRTVIDGYEREESAPFLHRVASGAEPRHFVDVPMQLPQATPAYTLGAASVGDLDGDGEYEIIVHAQQPPLGDALLQAYTFAGRLRWTIPLGQSQHAESRAPFLVYDLDGDGRAEVVAIEKGNDDGGEVLVIFDGLSGRVSAKKACWPVTARSERGVPDAPLLACIAYLDGVQPSVVVARSVRDRLLLAAWDWRERDLRQRWIFDRKNENAGTQIVAADVDGDGRDELVFPGLVIDDNGKRLYPSTGLSGGSAMHVGVFDPERPSALQVWSAHGNTAVLFDAADGKLVWTASFETGVGRVLAADVDGRSPGWELWGERLDLHTWRGKPLGATSPPVAHGIWWDGDLRRELLSGVRVTKWNIDEAREDLLLEAIAVRPGGPGGRPNLCADIFGDWREEIVVATNDQSALRIYTTLAPTKHRIRTLPHDPAYRLGLAAQSNVPLNPGFYLGAETKFPVRRPRIDIREPQRDK